MPDPIQLLPVKVYQNLCYMIVSAMLLPSLFRQQENMEYLYGTLEKMNKVACGLEATALGPFVLGLSQQPKGSGLGIQSVVPDRQQQEHQGALLEFRNLRLHPRPTGSESAF